MKYSLPIYALAAFTARFDPDLTELHFSAYESRVRINSAQLGSDGVYHINATHISGEEMRITLTPDATADFGYRVTFSAQYKGVWYDAN